MKAIWKDTVIAESDATVMVEGNHYFPEASVNRQYISFSNHKSSCAWKGQASYYSLTVNGDVRQSGRCLVLRRPQRGGCQYQRLCGVLEGRAGQLIRASS